MLEVLGFFTGLVSVWLAVRENVWTWPTGSLNSAAWGLLFVGSRLYTDAGLQLVYIALAVLGWYWWLRGGDRHSVLAVSRTPREEAIKLVAVGVLVTIAFTAMNARFTDTDVPFWDALTTVLSLVATYMLTRKRFENWYVWITVDVLYIALYSYKTLYLTAGLQVVFIGMCFAGLRDWRRSLREPETAAAEAVA